VRGEETTERIVNLRHSRNLLVIIATLLALAAVYFARDLLVPIVFAFFIAMAFRPAVRRLAKRGIVPWVSAGLFSGGLVLIVTAAASLFANPIMQSIAAAPFLREQLLIKLRGMKEALGGLLSVAREIQAAATSTAEIVSPQPAVSGSELAGIVSAVAGYPANFLIVVGAALVLATFLMASGDLFFEKLIPALPALSDKKLALRIVYDIEHEVSSYLLTITAINIGVGISVGLLFYWLGMPAPELWALAAFVLNFIPYLGPILATGASALVAFVAFPTIGAALLPPLAYILVTGLESQLVSPLLLSRRLQLNSVAILLALAFWAWAWGIPGIVVAVPILVTFRVLCSHISSLNVVGDFLGGSDRTADATNGTVEPAPTSKRTTPAKQPLQ
jgi:predicted PurR-regulated permease PerM